MKIFSGLKKNLKKDFSNLTAIKVALLGDSATQFLSIALRGMGFESGLDLQMWEADFNQVEQQIFDRSSALYAFKPDVVILFLSSHTLLQKYNKLHPSAQCALAESQLDLIQSLCNTINNTLPSKIICYNHPEIDDAIFGSYASKTPSSFIFQLRKLNYELMLYASNQPGFYICDLSAIQNQAGKATLFRPSVYVNTEMTLSIDILPQVASRTIDIIGATYGNFKKCLILDLDNTIWGGVIGDDGLENIQVGTLGIGKAFTEFQYWLKKLKNRGIILAVCSSNTASVAKEPFEKHPDMILHLDDFAVFIANWENKVDNIRKIQSLLNMGFDSMVFLDDSPFERNLVKTHILGITVPELPDDPADYLEYLYTLNLFETASFSKEDSERTKQYIQEADRSLKKQKYIDEDAFLSDLHMLSAIEPLNKFNAPRVAQLSQRSNQFNLRTVRYTDPDIERLASSTDHYNFTFTLEDKFGDNGLISMVMLQKESPDVLFIDNWIMSCRVLKRGMESFVLNTVVAFAGANGFNTLKGEYLPTPKNELVKNHYMDLGFYEKNGFWLLDTGSYADRKTHIVKK